MNDLYVCDLTVPLDDEGDRQIEYEGLTESEHIFLITLTQNEYDAIENTLVKEFNLAFDLLIDRYEEDTTKSSDILEGIRIAEYWSKRAKCDLESAAISKVLAALNKAFVVGRRMHWEVG